MTHVRRRLLIAGLTALSLTSCSARHFRERADKDVVGVLSQKDIVPEWKIENWHVYPNPEARFADPSCPDHPPFPPDDYAAWMLSPNPQRPHKKWGAGRFEGTGYLDRIAAWDAENREISETNDESKADTTYATATAANPLGAAALTGGFATLFATQQQPYRITLEQAVELGLFNSREFQDRREDLYLAALPVTSERFSFAAQALATENIVREVTGNQRPEGAGNRWRIGTDTSVSRLFPTGATLLFRFANQVVLDLSSSRPDIGISNISFTAIQPLLRGGGLAVTLEALTQAERTLLYAIRSYARFRKIYFVVMAGTGDYTNNPYGLQGLAANLGRAIGNNLTAPTAGFMPVVLRSGTLQNERKNLAALDDILKLYGNLKEGGVVSDLQVVRVELQYLQSQTRFLDSNRQYLDQLDNYKLQLGVPTNLPLELDDAPLRPMKKQLQRFEEVYSQFRELQGAAGKVDPNESPEQYRQRWKRLLTESSLVKGTPFSNDYTKLADEWTQPSDDALKEKLTKLTEQRRKLLDAKAERQAANKPEPTDEAKGIADVEDAIAFARFETALRRYEAKPWVRLPKERQANERAALFRDALDYGLLIALTARNQRLDTIRDEWPKLPGVVVEGDDLLQASYDDAATKVSQVALTNRLDLMNARAQVVDSYRQIAVRANALEGVFDVRYDLNTATPSGDNEAFAFAGSRTRHAVTLRAEPPFVRRVERNNYRAALISYQRQRRTLMAFEDNILNDVRADIRQLRTLAETYKVQQRAVELAYAQADNARQTLLAPPDPTARDAASSSANLTETLLQAQNQLLQAQNTLYTNWTNFITARMNLYLDLELLPLDTRGIWIDEQLPPPNLPVGAESASR